VVIQRKFLIRKISTRIYKTLINKEKYYDDDADKFISITSFRIVSTQKTQ